jgi:hypothetical protein
MAGEVGREGEAVAGDEIVVWSAPPPAPGAELRARRRQEVRLRALNLAGISHPADADERTRTLDVGVDGSQAAARAGEVADCQRSLDRRPVSAALPAPRTPAHALVVT